MQGGYGYNAPPGVNQHSQQQRGGSNSQVYENTWQDTCFNYLRSGLGMCGMCTCCVVVLLVVVVGVHHGAVASTPAPAPPVVQAAVPSPPPVPTSLLPPVTPSPPPTPPPPLSAAQRVEQQAIQQRQAPATLPATPAVAEEPQNYHWDDSVNTIGDRAMTAASTAAPTAAPTASPTPVPTPAPTPGIATVDFFFEIGCPVCEQLLNGVLQQLIQFEHKVNLKLHPFGNSFFATKECPVSGDKPSDKANPDPRYTPDARMCWDKHCLTPNFASDCFAGEMICQHGPKACELQNYAVCGVQAAGDDWIKALAYSQCLEKGFGMGTKYGWPANSVAQGILPDCAKKAGLDVDTLKSCATSDAVKSLTQAEAASTPQHHLVPKVIVNGEDLPGVNTNPDELMQKVRSIVTPQSQRRLLV